MSDVQEVFLLLDEAMDRYRNPEIAQQQSNYMRGIFPFAGIKAPVRHAIEKNWSNQLKDIAPALKWELVEALWIKPEREYQQLAIDWMSNWKKARWEETDGPQLEKYLVSKSWWDSVDPLAANCVGTWLTCFPERKQATIERWRNSDNLWLKRSCLIFQLRYKNDTDFGLLCSLIEQFRGEKEFFIQKAIGWSLRQYSKYEPEAVSAFIASTELSGLARREASKYL